MDLEIPQHPTPSYPYTPVETTKVSHRPNQQNPSTPVKIVPLMDIKFPPGFRPTKTLRNPRPCGQETYTPVLTMRLPHRTHKRNLSTPSKIVPLMDLKFPPGFTVTKSCVTSHTASTTELTLPSDAEEELQVRPRTYSEVLIEARGLKEE